MVVTHCGLICRRAARYTVFQFAANAPVAQLDRVVDFESNGWRFESSRARQNTIAPRAQYRAQARSVLPQTGLEARERRDEEERIAHRTWAIANEVGPRREPQEAATVVAESSRARQNTIAPRAQYRAQARSEEVVSSVSPLYS